MRVMIKFVLPVEDSNEAVRSGKLHKVFQQLAEDLNLKPAIFSRAVESAAAFSSSTCRSCRRSRKSPSASSSD